MALTLPDEWVQAVCRADFEPVWLIELTNGTWSYKFTKGSTDLGYEEAVLSVEPLAPELDPLTRSPKSGSTTIVFDGRRLRHLVSTVQLKHQKCIVKIGAPELDEGDYVTVSTGPIEEIRTANNGQFVVMEAEDIYALLQRTKIIGYFHGHHLSIIEDILLNKVGLDSTFVDSTSLDPTEYSDIGHLVTARGVGKQGGKNFSAMHEPEDAYSLVQGLARLLNGQLVINESGQLSFAKYDSSASAVDSWDSDVIIPGSFEQLGEYDKIINRVQIGFDKREEGRYYRTYEANETASQAALAYPDMSERILAVKFDTPWVEYAGVLQSDITNVATSMTVRGPLWAWSGGLKERGVSQDSTATATSGRPAYLLLTGLYGEEEIVKVTSYNSFLVSGYAGYSSVSAVDPTDGAVDQLGEFAWHATLTVARSQLGTTAPANGWKSADTWGGDLSAGLLSGIYDITALVLLGDALLTRFSEGMHMVRVRTRWDRWGVQVGDFVTLEHDEFLAYGYDGLTTATKWEVLKKEPAADGPPEIEWLLGIVRVSSLTRTGRNVGDRLDVLGGARYALAQDGTVQPRVINGFDLTDDGGLVATISAGTAAASTEDHAVMREDYQYTFTASTTTYVIFDTLSEQLIFSEAASEPFMEPGYVLLWEVVTDGSDITGTTDRRLYHAVGLSILNREQEVGAAINLNPALGMYTRR